MNSARPNELKVIFQKKMDSYGSASHKRVKQLLGGIDYIDSYLIGYWMHEGRYEEWSSNGRDRVSVALIRARSYRLLISNPAPTTTKACESENNLWKYAALKDLLVNEDLPPLERHS